MWSVGMSALGGVVVQVMGLEYRTQIRVPVHGISANFSSRKSVHNSPFEEETRRGRRLVAHKVVMHKQVERDQNSRQSMACLCETTLGLGLSSLLPTTTAHRLPRLLVHCPSFLQKLLMITSEDNRHRVVVSDH